MPLALLLGVMLTAIAAAADGKVYPGTMCRERVVLELPPGNLVFDGKGIPALRYSTGTALNRSTTHGLDHGVGHPSSPRVSTTQESVRAKRTNGFEQSQGIEK